MANWQNNFPEMGDTGEKPPDGQNWQGGDQVNEKHFDYLWDQIDKTVDDILSHTLQDDGSVTMDDGATAITFADDAGAAETLFDMAVSGTPVAGTEQSVVGKLDGTALFKLYAEANGSGGIQSTEVRPLTTLNVNSNDIEDGGTTIYDQSAGHIVQSILENDSITVTAGDGLKAGGAVALGSSVTIDVDVSDFAGTNLEDDGSENLRIATSAAGDGLSGGGINPLSVDVSDFAGTFLSDDGSENLTVDIGNGLENDGVGNVRVDEDFSFTFTSPITINNTLDVDTLDVDGNTAIQSVAASGEVTLSGGSAVVGTGIAAANATFLPALGIDDPNADTKISSRLFWDDSAGEYKLEIVESGTAVDNPTINYDIIRTR